MKIDERLEVRLARLRDHPARFVLHEAVDQNAVVLGHRSHALGCKLTQRLERFGIVEPLDHLLHPRERVGGEPVLRVGGFELEDQHAAAAMQARVERLIGIDAQ